MKYNNKKDIKSIKSDNINKTTNLNKKGGYSFFSALTRALSYFTPSTELNNIKTEKKIQLNKSKGVKYLFEVITKNKKIIVGYNCILDILLCISQFDDSVPNSYQDFKKLNLYFNDI